MTFLSITEEDRIFKSTIFIDHVENGTGHKIACTTRHPILNNAHNKTRAADTTEMPDAVTERMVAHIPLYKVLLHNDDKNTTDHVIKSLMKVFHFGQAKCERIMLEAHHNGIALCIIESLEQAEFHRDQLLSFSLVATIEPE